MSSLRYTVALDAPRAATSPTSRCDFARGRAATVDVALPAWCPGSYLIRDYARFVRDLEATGDDGVPRADPRSSTRRPGASTRAGAAS